MQLMTKEIEGKLPALYSQEKNPNPNIIVKFFDPERDLHFGFDHKMSEFSDLYPMKVSDNGS